MVSGGIGSIICTCSLVLLYINILAVLFMSKSLISTTEWNLPASSSASVFSQYYDFRTRLLHSANYSCTFSQNKVVIVQHFTLTYPEFFFVSLVILLSGVYCTVKITQNILRLFNGLGILWVKEDDADCPICMESMKRFILVSSLPCGHHFCRTCLKLWLEKFRYRTCPLCRQNVVPDRNDDEDYRISYFTTFYRLILVELSVEDYGDSFLY